MEEIDLKELFNVLVKKMYIIVLTTIFCALLGFIYSKFIVTPMYNSSTSFVLSKSENGQNTSITQNDLTLNSKLVSTYGAIIKSKTIASSVIKELGLNMRYTLMDVDTTNDKINGKTFVITGTLSKPRDEFKEKLESLGANVTTSVTKKTDYVLAGEKAGSKLDEAKELNIKIINEDEYLKMIE